MVFLRQTLCCRCRERGREREPLLFIESATGMDGGSGERKKGSKRESEKKKVGGKPRTTEKKEGEIQDIWVEEEGDSKKAEAEENSNVPSKGKEKEGIERRALSPKESEKEEEKEGIDGKDGTVSPETSPSQQEDLILLKVSQIFLYQPSRQLMNKFYHFQVTIPSLGLTKRIQFPPSLSVEKTVDQIVHKMKLPMVLFVPSFSKIKVFYNNRNFLLRFFFLSPLFMINFFNELLRNRPKCPTGYI
jgi:hypothetical protein